ncbi:hypothetical protein NEMIN01_1272 [Nematocida minor]|uniref:uncharacterized protein n=1 Tax=Nematocida minor TaxID=1912983 RepID=UPI00221FF8A2|nr:uncharacterized protein NEMIN01_1272 [Nematocida minor]KAI5190939.1 hypothetical protein NEMIN01_1272 [Nematocida minor]
MSAHYTPEIKHYFGKNKEERKAFYCHPNLSLFEHYTAFQSMPRDRADILKLLEKYFKQKFAYRTDALEEKMGIFQIVEAEWYEIDETEYLKRVQLKTAKFPVLNEQKLGYYDKWQFNFIQQLLNNQVSEENHLTILRQVTSFKLFSLCEKEESLAKALRLLKTHASFKNGVHTVTGIKQDEFLFFKDYIHAAGESASSMASIGIIPAEIVKQHTQTLIENGLGVSTRRWIHMKSSHGMSWKDIVDYINLKEHSIAATLIQEQECKSKQQKNVHPISSSAVEQSENPSSELYCTHHRVSTHATKDCFALQGRKAHSAESSPTLMNSLLSEGNFKKNSKHCLSLKLCSESINAFSLDSKIPVAKGRINGIHSIFVLNAGSDANIITTAAQRNFSLQDIYEKEEKILLYTVERSLRVSARYIQATVQLDISPQSSSVERFLLFPNKDCMIVLGMPWIKENYAAYLLHLIPSNKIAEIVSELKKRYENGSNDKEAAQSQEDKSLFSL